MDFLSPSEEPDCLGRLGSYEITAVVGRGGMGVVLKGRDPELNRVVAIKVLAPELALNAMARKRFSREARAAAAVSHDHVVTIHSINQTDRLPHLAMEFVNGQSLQQRLDRSGPLELKEILRIGKQAAAGLAAAHAEGLIHRDIKPANILLENGVERVKITDFGLARAVDDVGLTQTGVVAGTPQYMSPEQAQGERVDHRTDLFSLGSVLYAMCTGRPPFRADSTIAVIRRVCDDTPRPIQQVNPDIPDWLAAIIDRLLAKKPNARFESAAQVAELLGQHLAHIQQPSEVPQPVPVLQTADRSRPSQANRRSTAKHWAVAAILLLVLFGSLSFTEATGRTQITATVIRVVQGEGTLVVEVDDPAVSVQIDGEELIITGAGVREVRVRPGKHQIHALKDGKPVHQELVTITRGGRQVVKVDLVPLTEAGPPAAQSDSAAESTAPVMQIPRAKRLFTGELADSNEDIAISPDGKRAMTGGFKGQLCLWDIETGRELRRFLGVSRVVQSVAISPDGRYGLSSSHDPTIRLWDLETGKQVRQFKGHTGFVRRVAFSPDGRLILSTSADYDKHVDNTLRLWDAQTGRELRRLEGFAGPLNDTAFSPDGKQVAGTDDQQVFVWNVKTGRLVQQFILEGTLAFRLAFSPDGRFLVSGHRAQSKRDGKWYDPERCVLKLWDVQSGRVLRTFRGHTGPIQDVAFSPDGRHILSASSDGYDGSQLIKSDDRSIRLWDVATGVELVRYLPEEDIRSIAFAPDGRTFLSAGRGTVRLWDVPASITAKPQPLTEVRRLKGHQERVYFVGHSVDGRYVYSVSRDQTLRLWDTATGRQLKQFHTKAPLRSADVSREGRILVAGGHDGTMTVWDVESGDVIRELRDHKDGVYAVALSDDAKQLAAATRSGSVKLWDLATGRTVWEARGVGLSSYAVDFSPDGRQVMVCTQTAIRILDRKNGNVVSQLSSGGEGFVGGFRNAAYSPDGRWVAVGCWEDVAANIPSRVGIWDGKTDQPMRWLGAHEDGVVTGVSFSPDGRYLWSSGVDRTLRLWDIESGQQLAAVETDTQCTQFVSSLPDGNFVITGGGERWDVAQDDWAGDGDYALRLWRLPQSVSPKDKKDETELTEVRHFEGHTKQINTLAISANGRRVVTAADDKTVRVWDVQSGREVVKLEQTTTHDAMSLDISPDGTQIVIGGGWSKGAISVWDVASGEKIRQIDAPAGASLVVRLSPDGSRFASGGPDKVVRLWDLADGRQLAELQGHTDQVCSLAFSPDGLRLLSGSFDKSVRLWDLKRAEHVREYSKIGGHIRRLTFAPDGDHFVAASYQPDFWLFDVNQSQPTRRFQGHQEKPSSLLFTPDGQTIISGSPDKTLRIWDVKTGRELASAAFDHHVTNHLALVPNSNLVVAAGGSDMQNPARLGDGDYAVHLWQLPESVLPKEETDANKLTELRRFEGHKHWITGVAFTPDGRQAASVANDHSLRIWDVSIGKTIRRIELEKAATAVGLSNHARYLAVAVGSWAKKKDAGIGLVLLLDFETGKEIRRFEGHANTITAVAFSPDDRFLATAGSDGTSRLWNVATGEQLRRLDECEGTIGGVRFTPDGRRLVTCEQFRAAHVWNVETGRVLHRLGKEGKTELRGIELAPDGRTVLLLHGRGAFELFDMETGRSVGRFNSPAELVPTDVLFTRDGRWLLVGSTDKTLRLLEVRSGRELTKTTADGHVFNVSAISPDGRSVLSGGGKYWDPVDPEAVDGDYNLRLWKLPESVWPKEETDANKLTEVRRFEGHTRMINSVAVSPDGRFLLSADLSGVVLLSDLETAKTEKPFAWHAEGVSDVCFGRDGTAFSCSTAPTVRRWDVQSGQTIRRYVGHTAFVRAVAVSPDGKHLLTGSSWYANQHQGTPQDNSPRLWDVETAEEVRRFEDVLFPIRDAAFAPDGKSIVAGGKNSTLGLWDVETGKRSRRFTVPASVRSVAFSPDGTKVASSHDGGLKDGRFFDPEHSVIILWDVETGREIRRLRGHTARIHSIAFSPDARFIASAAGAGIGTGGWHEADENTVRIWDVATGEELARAEPGIAVQSIAFTPDGRYVVTGGGRSGDTDSADLRLWTLPESVWPEKSDVPE